MEENDALARGQGLTALLVAGVVCGLWLGARAERGRVARAEAWKPAQAGPPISSQGQFPSIRQLRQARGVGRAKAMDLADFLWGVDHDLSRLEEMPGIGPRTAAAVREALTEIDFSLHSEPARPPRAHLHADPGNQSGPR